MLCTQYSQDISEEELLVEIAEVEFEAGVMLVVVRRCIAVPPQS
jgi:hypothetical protein